MRQYSIVQALPMAAVCSKSLYRDVARNWRGIGLGYLFVLLLITWLPVAILAHIGFREFVAHDLPPHLKDVPPVTIQDGVASSPVPQPYTLWKDPKTGNPAAILDTTGEITSLEKIPAVLLITRDKLMMRDTQNGQIRIVPLSELPSFHVDKDVLQGVAWHASTWVAPFVMVVCLSGSIAWKKIVILIYAAIGLTFNNHFRAGLSYGALMRLVAVAITPIVLLDTVLWLTNVTIPGWWPISIAAGIGLTALAVSANRATGPGFPVNMGPYMPPFPGAYPPPPGPQMPPPPLPPGQGPVGWQR